MAINMDIGQDNFAETHSAILRRYVGDARRQDNSRKILLQDLAPAINKHPRTVKSWKNGVTCPTISDWRYLARVLGPHYVNDFLRHAGFGNATPLEFSASTQVSGNHAQYELALRMASLSEAMLDGHIDRIERSQLIPQFEHLVSMLNLFVWGLKQSGSSAPGGAPATIRKD
ncbi:helix-turn-helix transcriptional regulator [Thalassospira xiamenensis]|uniref:helix-turn-helix domain-containing protein n=1 Tax=Thalassospira xiamenensis TaxID=220697 RepID=UPI000DEDE61D|nr:helix-turn-helix transcriptional regulator [Thalassospira xiamenensis]